MAGTDRRESIRLAIGAALLSFLSARAVHAQPGSGEPSIQPPRQAMIYRRKMEKALPGGSQSLSVQRDFLVRFSPLADGGFLVSGEQQAVEVEVPAALETLAALERARVEDGVFPIRLDSSGRITGWPAPSRDEQIAQALASVRDRFARSGNEVGMLIEALHDASSSLVATLPEDLFAPGDTVREQSREIELPWGDRGEVLTRFEAQCDPQTRLMRQAQRLVTTRLGGEERQNCESWSLLTA